MQYIKTTVIVTIFTVLSYFSGIFVFQTIIKPKTDFHQNQIINFVEMNIVSTQNLKWEKNFSFEETIAHASGIDDPSNRLTIKAVNTKDKTLLAINYVNPDNNVNWKIPPSEISEYATNKEYFWQVSDSEKLMAVKPSLDYFHIVRLLHNEGLQPFTQAYLTPAYLFLRGALSFTWYWSPVVITILYFVLNILACYVIVNYKFTNSTKIKKAVAASILYLLFATAFYSFLQLLFFNLGA